MTNLHIDVHHVTRIEGHGNIVVNTSNGRIEKCEWQVPEAPRFFEAMVRNRHYSEVSRITSRICGICAIGHSLCSVKATEVALGIRVSRQTALLRNLLKHAEIFDSNVLHVLFLAAPDLLGVSSVFPLVKTHKAVIQVALRLKRLAHEWGSLIAGRTTHATTVVPGGFGALPSTEDLANLIKRFEKELLPDLKVVLEVLVSLSDKFPKFERPTEYMALHAKDEYAFYDGVVQTVMPDGTKEQYAVENYKSLTNEYMTPHSTAKWTRHNLESYMAGALARFNNNADQLHPEAKKVAKLLGLAPLCHNTYLNTAAQAAEIVHSVHRSLELLDKLATAGIKDEEPRKPTKHGEGTASVEVPRGILFHHYKYDREFMCTGADCVIPTNQNHGNIQLDFEKLVPELLASKMAEKEIELRLEMLVRAYDPCVSCSTHYLKVKFAH
ncbi:MAG: nickel-dependent hydrogenase large subunit [Pseudomonadota bacterium]